MYSVSLYSNISTKEFAITVRDFQKSKHWRLVDSTHLPMRVDSREDVFKPFFEIANFEDKSDAKRFATVVEAGFALAKWKKISVKVKKG